MQEKAQAPRVFIGSSVEGLAVAEAIQVGLEYAAECTIWSQGVFGLSGGTLESLLAATRQFEFAVLVVTPDDLISKRAKLVNAPRDNVLFELGLFMGALGRDRVAIVFNRDRELSLPTDLAGVTCATFPERQDGNLEAALGPVCTKLKRMLVLRQSPEAVLASHGERLEALLERMIDRERIAKRAEQAEMLEAELESLREELASLRSVAKDLLCPHCEAPAWERGGASESVEYDGRDVDVDHEWTKYECGLEIVDGEVRKQCRTKAGA